MTCCTTYDLCIPQRETFTRILRWSLLPYIYKAITGITATAPAVVTAVGHGLPDGWRVAVVSAGGMRQINAGHNPPISSEYHKATVLTADTVALNDVNAASYTAYTSGGYLQFYSPASLAGYTAKFTVWATDADAAAGNTPLLTVTTSTSAPLSSITLDDTAKTITLLISETDVAALTWTTGFYELVLVASDGTTTELLGGTVTVGD